jgi:hypothetical protein
MEAVGASLVVAGAIVAFVTLLLAVFVQGTVFGFTWTLLDSEVGAIIGIVLVIAGIAAHAAD